MNMLFALLAIGSVAFGAGSPASGLIDAEKRPLVHFGTAYYPEAWDRANWEPDLIKMKELGVDLVRLGEFNWSGFEPREGEFRFDDYLAFLDLCEKHGLKAMMCTPTAAVPRWMFANYPGVRKVREDGSFAPDGIRHATCVHSPDCRRFCDRIVRKMAEAFREHPAVVMWQVDNELSIRGATGLCVCTNCQQAFRAALRKRYKTVENLNREMNGIFWSNVYNDFDEVTVPMRWASRRNWAREYVRFQGEGYVDAVLRQKAILQAANPRWCITSNNPGCSGDLRYDDLFAGLGYAACDIYLDAAHVRSARWSWSMFRGLTGAPRKFMVAETGAFNSANARACSLDALKAWYWESVMHGAESYVYFRWRESCSGEEEHPAILPWSGKPGCHFEKIRAYRRELDRLPPIATLPLDRAKVAIVHDSATAQYDSVRYMRPFCPLHERLHDAMERFGVMPDLVMLRDDMDLSGYSLVLLPLCETVSAAQQEKLRVFVRGGGNLLALCKLNCTGADGGAYVTTAYPAGMTDLFGVEVHERRFLGAMGRGDGYNYSQQKYEDVPLDFPGDEPFTGRDVVEEVTSVGCEIVQTLSETLFKGAPLLTRQVYGAGAAWYLATLPGEAGAKALCRKFLPLAGESVDREWPASVLRARRGRYVVLVNSDEKPALVPAETGKLLMGTPKPLSEGLELAPYEVAVYEENAIEAAAE